VTQIGLFGSEYTFRILQNGRPAPRGARYCTALQAAKNHNSWNSIPIFPRGDCVWTLPPPLVPNVLQREAFVCVLGFFVCVHTADKLVDPSEVVLDALTVEMWEYEKVAQ
jgi:hypothetical protein